MDRKRIQCWSNALQHVPIYLQPFLRYSEISVASEWFLTIFVSKWAFFTTFCFPWVRPWDDRGKCHMVGKRIQCLSNVNMHEAYTLRGSLRECRRHERTSAAAPAAPVPAAAGILVTAPAPEQPEQFLVTPVSRHCQQTTSALYQSTSPVSTTSPAQYFWLSGLLYCRSDGLAFTERKLEGTLIRCMSRQE